MSQDKKNPFELVRVENPKTGAQFSSSRRYAEAAGFKVLEDKPARDEHDRAIPTKFKVNARSTHAEIDEAAAAAGVDLSGSKTKAEKLDALGKKES